MLIRCALYCKSLDFVASRPSDFALLIVIGIHMFKNHEVVFVECSVSGGSASGLQARARHATRLKRTRYKPRRGKHEKRQRIMRSRLRP